jgi:hypothetical protein
MTQTKYYVESGPQFRIVALARTPVEAIIRALDMKNTYNSLDMAEVIIVNERGFVWDREDHKLNGDELVIPTELMLDEAMTDDTFIEENWTFEG